jgi:CHASE3 domain sensor protein
MAGFGVMVCLAAITASVAIYALRSVVASKDRVITIYSHNLTDAAEMKSAAYQESVGFRGFLLVPAERFFRDINAGRAAFAECLTRLEKGVYRPEGKRMLKEVRDAHSTMAAEQDHVVELRRTHARTDLLVQEMEAKAVPAREKLTQGIQEFITWEQQLLQQAEHV